MPIWRKNNFREHYEKRVTADAGCFESLMGISGRMITEKEYEARTHHAYRSAWAEYEGESKDYGRSAHFVDSELVVVITDEHRERYKTCYHEHFDKKPCFLLGQSPPSAGQLQLKYREQLENDVRGKVIRKECDDIAAKACIEAQQAVAVEIRDRDTQLQTMRAQLKAFEAQELELRKRARHLQEQSEQQELELARRLDEERSQIRETALKQADEQSAMKLAEQQLKIDTLARQLQEAQRRLEQGSQQIQGDVQEIALEAMLTAEFPNDVIERVGKGTNGGDVIHHVFDRNGRECGVILWESKRTKSWGDKWIGKALDDQQEAKATCTCIVTAAMPDGIEHIGELNGVWVSSWACARSAATALRRVLIEAAQARVAADGQHEKTELIYSFVNGPEFKNRFIGLIRPCVEMEADLQSEMRAIHARWKKRRKQLDRLMMSTSGLYGDFHGIIGASMQRIDEMEMLAIEADAECPERPLLDAD